MGLLLGYLDTSRWWVCLLEDSVSILNYDVTNDKGGEGNGWRKPVLPPSQSHPTHNPTHKEN